jgi:FKBP-type peptidyl-prolyl cis-trans isomerase SlyD
MASMGDGLALAAAEATIASRRKPVSDEASKPSAPSTIDDSGNA